MNIYSRALLVRANILKKFDHFVQYITSFLSLIGSLKELQIFLKLPEILVTEYILGTVKITHILKHYTDTQVMCPFTQKIFYFALK